MKRCTLANPDARMIVANVWRHLRSHFPAEARFLKEIITRIEPLKEEEVEDGTQGQWIGTNFPGCPIESPAWRERFDRLFDGDEHGTSYGMIKLRDDDGLSTAYVAHEMGHAFASLFDHVERNSPDTEWASEATADMHAVRWGLLTLEDIRNRYAANIAATEGVGVTCGSACVHHGPPPGGGWIELYSQRWRLREDFVFEVVEA